MNKLTSEEESELNLVLERINTGDHYHILGIKRDSDIGAIRTAYFTLSKTFHPDMFYRRAADGIQEKVEAIFTGINLSYEVLSDDVLRRKLDIQLVRKEREEGGSRGRSRRRQRRERDGDAVGEELSEVLDADTQATVKSTTARGDRARARARIREELGASKTQRTRRSSRAGSRSRTSSEDSAGSSSTTGRFSRDLRDKISERVAKGKSYYEKGMAAMEDQDWAKAASALQMATQFNPNSEEYTKVYDEVRPKAASVRAAGFIRAAESAESFRNVKEAIYNYQQAVDCDPPGGTAYFRLGQLLLDYASEPREALKHFRRAVVNEPDTLKYRLALADLYVGEGMGKNAQREYQRVLKADPKNKSAKSALKKLRF
jgi:curved DNA-binding protein CbpA